MAHGKRELIDFLAGLLAGVVETDVPYRSETALAAALDADLRKLHDLRRSGLVTPRRLGRGYVYDPGDVRRCSVLLALMRLGATLADLQAFFAGGRARCPSCPSREDERACSIERCCEALLEDLRARTEDEITRLRALDGLLQQYAVDVWQDHRAARRPD